MRQLFPFLLVLLLAAMSVASARGQTPGPATSQAGASADLAGVRPLPLTGEHRAEFESYIAGMLATTQVPGAAVAVVQNGEVVYQQGFGVRELGGSEPVTPQTLMMIGSITKPMTATMAATVVDDGDINWDTPVVNLLFRLRLDDAGALFLDHDIRSMPLLALTGGSYVVAAGSEVMLEQPVSFENVAPDSAPIMTIAGFTPVRWLTGG